MKAKGYAFTNLTEALGAPSAHTPVTGADLWKGKALDRPPSQASGRAITDVLVVGLAIDRRRWSSPASG